MPARPAVQTASAFPTSLPAFQARFGDDAACRDYLLTLRSGAAFRCPRCGHGAAWTVRSRGLLTCRSCRRQVSATSGGALDHLRLPLSLVFLAAFLVATIPSMNAITLARQLGIDRHKTAWLLLAKLRRAMATALTDPLTGTIEADEAWFGGPQERAKQRKYGRWALMVLALAEARKDGRVRLVRIGDNTTTTLMQTIAAHIEPGSIVQTDGWRSYNALPRHGYQHVRKPHTPGWAKRGDRSTPYADEAISAAKRWLLATYNKPPREQLPTYLAEFAFRREIRDPGARFEALLRALLFSPPTPRRIISSARDLPIIAPGPRKRTVKKKSAKRRSARRHAA